MYEDQSVLVTIIVPIYNAEEYLTRCVNSILAQTYHNFELILVDDGSTDNSGTICDKYAETDQRVRVFHIPNGGVSNARNTGLEAVKGKFVLFVDSDDWIMPNHVQKLLPEEDEDLVCCGYTQYVNSIARDNTCPVKKVVYRETWSENFWKFWVKNAILPPWRSCYRTQIVRKQNIRFDTSLHIGEDEQFNLQYFQYCRKVRFTEHCTYNYEIGSHPSAMQKYHPSRLLSAIAISQAIEQIAGKPVYAAMWYHWHGAIRHLDKWASKKKGIEKSYILQKLRECYCEPYFRACIPYTRKNGSLDERIETFFMRRWSHPYYKSFYGAVSLAANVKNKLMKKNKTEENYD